jgi:hypothetical protein
MVELTRPAVWACPHDAHDWANLALARLAAAHIRAHPEALQVARDRIGRWVARGGLIPGMVTTAHEWLKLMDDLSPDALADFLESETEKATRLRSSMPFIREPFFTRQESLLILEKAYS